MTLKLDYGEKSLPEISAFSKHLMLLIIAVFAMLTPLLFNSVNVYVRILLYFTLLIVLIGFYIGHKVLTKIIELYLNPRKQNIDFHSTKSVINALRFQFSASILSAILLVITYGVHIVTTNNGDKTIETISKKVDLLFTADERLKLELGKLRLEQEGIAKMQLNIKDKPQKVNSELIRLKAQQNKMQDQQTLLLDRIEILENAK